MPILVLTLLGGFLRFFMLGHQGFWFDEAYTAFLMKFSFGKMLGLIPSQESTPPLYYSVAWVWTHIFGQGRAGLRSLSALCGTLTIPVVYVAGRQLLANYRSAVIVTALTACNPLLIWYSQEARAYSMMVLLCACTLAAFAYALERPRPELLAIWAIFSILALATHYYSGFLIVPEAAWLLYQHRRRRGVRIAISAVIAGAAALLPILLAQSTSGNDSWIAGIPLTRRLGQLIPMSLIGTGAPDRDLLKFIAFAAALVGLATLAWRSRRRERQAALLVGGLLAGGFALSLLSLLASDTLLARNLLPLWLPAAMLLACGLGGARAWVAGICATVVLCAVGITAVVGVDSDQSLQRPNWQPVAQALGPPPATGDRRLVIIQRNLGLLPIGLYLPDLGYARGRALKRVTEIDIVAERSPPSGGACWWGAACNLVGSHLQRQYRIAGFHALGGPVEIEQFHVLRLVAQRPTTVTRAEIRHALTETRLGRDAFLAQP